MPLKEMRNTSCAPKNPGTLSSVLPLTPETESPAAIHGTKRYLKNEKRRKRNMKHLTSILAGTAAAAAMLLGTAAIPAMAQDNTIEVGVISPLTGRNAVQGEDIVRGIKLAVKRINNGYEVPMEDGSTVKVGPDKLGGKIKLIIEDTESRPASALSAVRKLVNADHVPVVLGVLSSGICVPTGHFTNQN